MNSLNDLWNQVLSSLSGTISSTAYKTWFAGCEPIEITPDGVFIIKVENDFKNKGIEIINGEAILDPLNKTITCNGQEFLADKIVIATGSKPFEIKGLEFDHNNILSSDDIFNLENLPKSIAIVGSGAIGIEWTRILNNLGVEVTLIEACKNLLPAMDLDISKRIERICKIKKRYKLKGA